MGYLEDEIDRHAKEKEDKLEAQAEPTEDEIEARGQMFIEGGGRRHADEREVNRELRSMEMQADEPNELRVLYLKASEQLERDGREMLSRARKLEAA